MWAVIDAALQVMQVPRLEVVSGGNVKIYVVTPVWHGTNRDWLDQCIRSVNEQSIGGISHILVNDGTGFEQPIGFQGVLLHCGKNHNDFGDTPRHQGVQHARASGADAIAFLDDDNWFEENHLENALSVHAQHGSDVVFSRRHLIHIGDGTSMGVCNRCGIDDWADTSAAVYFGRGLDTLRVWGEINDAFHAIDDRVVSKAIKDDGLRVGRSGEATLNYRCTHRIIYEHLGRVVPKGAKSDNRVEAAVKLWEEKWGPQEPFIHGVL